MVKTPGALSGALAAAAVAASLAACGGGSAARPATAPSNPGMTVNQIGLLCENMGAAGQPGTGITYASVVQTTISFAPQLSHRRAVTDLAYIVHKGCPQYTHLLPGGH
jgi:hypothetical protein